MGELASSDDVIAHAARLLDVAGARGRFPTPVDDLVEAAGLTEPEESFLSDSVLRQAPAYFKATIKRLLGRVLGAVDRREREVHIAPDVTIPGRRRFIKLHEVLHGFLPWQVDLAYADDDRTLAPQIRQRFELEASLGAAELLFQGPTYAADVADLQIGLAALSTLRERYGSTLRAALWRYPEEHRAAVATAVLDPSPVSLVPLRFRRHEVRMSPSFAARFGGGPWPSQLTVDRFPFLVAASAAGEFSTVVAGEASFRALDGAMVDLRVEALCTGYATLVMLWVPIAERTRKRLRVAA